MATNKNAPIRYHTLDRCFQNLGVKYFIEDLVDACCLALQNYSNNQHGIEKRQIFEDIKFMENEQGCAIFLLRYKEGKEIY
jgi:hypothetical protein